MPIKGVDTTDHTLTGAILKAHGYAFVTRYYAGHTSTIGKEIVRAEVVEKTQAGVRIVCNWETDGKPANTVAAGEAHARAFLKQHAEIGGPTWAPCYFSIDHAVGAGACDLYFTGIRNVLGVARVGCYGEGALIRHLKAKGLISLGWLAMATAWPGGRDTTGCDLHQTGRGTVAGHDVDFNTALSGYYGGWLDGETSPQEDDMDLTLANTQAIADKVLNRDSGVLPSLPGDPASAGKSVSLATRVNVDAARLIRIETAVTALTAIVKGQLADAIAAAVVKQLPAGGATAAQIQAAADAGVSDAIGRLTVSVDVAPVVDPDAPAT